MSCCRRWRGRKKRQIRNFNEMLIIDESLWTHTGRNWLNVYNDWSQSTSDLEILKTATTTTIPTTHSRFVQVGVRLYITISSTNSILNAYWFLFFLFSLNCSHWILLVKCTCHCAGWCRHTIHIHAHYSLYMAFHLYLIHCVVFLTKQQKPTKPKIFARTFGSHNHNIFIDLNELMR